jgi:predicted nuclease of predicted toxin-antitoxin system
VKLLLDENLSDRIISQIADLFPDSTHTKAVGLREADDFVVWGWAKKHGFTIVSKDTGSTTEPLRPMAILLLESVG